MFLTLHVTWRFVLFAVSRVRVLLGSHTYGEHSFFFAESATLMKSTKTQTTLLPCFPLPHQITGL